MKITKKAIREYVREKLGTDAQWALRGLVVIYQNQTQDEQSDGVTRERNDIGFSGADSEIMSSFAEQYERWGRLSQKQLAIVFKKMPKYWKQILAVSNMEKIEKLVSKSMVV
jgi:hypothetical protein